MSIEVFVFCDDTSHAPKRVPLATFVRIPSTPMWPGGWHERARGRVGRAGHVGTGMTMIGDTLPQDGWAQDDSVDNSTLRERYEIACERTPSCSRRVVSVQASTLFSVLDTWADTGGSELSLTSLAAMLGKRGRRQAD